MNYRELYIPHLGVSKCHQASARRLLYRVRLAEASSARPTSAATLTSHAQGVGVAGITLAFENLGVT